MKTEVFSISLLLTLEKGKDPAEVVRKLWDAANELSLPDENMSLTISRIGKEAELECD